MPISSAAYTVLSVSLPMQWVRLCRIELSGSPDALRITAAAPIFPFIPLPSVCMRGVSSPAQIFMHKAIEMGVILEIECRVPRQAGTCSRYSSTIGHLGGLLGSYVLWA